MQQPSEKDLRQTKPVGQGAGQPHRFSPGASLRLLLLALRSITARPTRAASTVAAIALGVGVILAISITNSSTLDSVNALFNETSGKSHLMIVSASEDVSGFSESVLRKIANIPEIQFVVPSLQAQAILADSDIPDKLDFTNFGVAFDGVTLYGIDPALDREARVYKLVDGAFLPVDTDAYEVVLVKDFAEKKKLRVGSDLRIATPSGVESLRVIGLMSKEGAGQLAGGSFGIVPIRVAQRLFSRAGEFDQLDIVATPAAASVTGLEQLKRTLQDRLGAKFSVIYPAMRGQRVTQMLSSYQLGLNFFGAISLFVGAFLIYNAFSMTVIERTRQIGMLRTVGMTRSQVAWQILSEAVLLALIGALLGVGVGALLARGLIRFMEIMYHQEVTTVRIPLNGLLASIGVGLVVTLIAAAIPAWQAGRISPLEALRARSHSRPGWLTLYGWRAGIVILAASLVTLYFSPFSTSVQYALGGVAVIGLFLGATLLIPVSVGAWERVARPGMRRVYGQEGRIGSSNIQRSRMRTALTVVALMVGTAMVLAIGATTAGFEVDIRDWIDKYVGGDLFINASVPMSADMTGRLQAVEGVEVATPLRYFDIKWQAPDGEKLTLTLMAIDPASYQRVTTVAFASGQGDPGQLLAELAQGNTVFISNVLSEKYYLKQGDTIKLDTRSGRQDFRIAAVAVNFQSQGKILMGSWRDMRRYFGINTISAFLIKCAPSYSPEEVKASIDRQYGARRHLTIDTNRVLKQEAISMMGRAFSLFNVLVLIAMVVAALGVVNTLTMSVLERTREIGMLRSLGMTRRQVGKMILAEAGMMGLMGGGLGLVYGIILGMVFVRGTAAVSGYAIGFTLPLEGVLFGIVISLIVSHLAAIGPVSRAAKTRIIEAIQFE